MNTYLIGNAARASVRFINATTGAATDPTTVVLRVKDPVLTVTVYTYGVDAILVKDSVGNYHLDIPLNSAGVWRYRWEGTGTNQAAAESQFTVTASTF